MSSLLAKVLVLGSVLTGFCLPVQANTTVGEPTTMMRVSDITIPPGPFELLAPNLATMQQSARVALLLPLRSETLRAAAEVVRAGFQAAHEREPGSMSISVVETGDAPADVLASYKTANAMYDIIVGPMSRSGVTAVAQSGDVTKPTIALTPPDNTGETESKLPLHMLVVGLSIEDDARQVARMAAMENREGRAVVLFTGTAWQRRAAKAFETEWQKSGRQAESLELTSNEGYLTGRELLQLNKDMQANRPAFFFLALDALQARQVRAIMGPKALLYGTSQLNPVALSDWNATEPMNDMNGTRLIDIPWQLQADHPAVMVYPRLVTNPDQRRNPDLERLYALGIDAYRIAQEIAAQHGSFELDGVTGKLTIRFDNAETRFERVMQPAVYQGGIVVPLQKAQ